MCVTFSLQLISRISHSVQCVDNARCFCCRCFSCHADCTRSTDLRLIKEHCVTVDKDFAIRAVMEDCIVTKRVQHWRKDKIIKCGKCLGNWGIGAFYKGCSYNVLIATNFEILGPDASCAGPFNSWNEVPFKIHKLRQRRETDKPPDGSRPVEKTSKVSLS